MKLATLFFIVANVLAIIGIGCSNGTPMSENGTTPGPEVDIPLLVNKSSQEVEAILGRALKSIAISEGPDSPGEYREYRVLENKGLLTIRFLRNKPARFVFDFTPALKNVRDEELAALFGFDLKGKTASSMGTAPYSVRYWKGNFSGVTFQDVRITSSDGGLGEFRATP